MNRAFRRIVACAVAAGLLGLPAPLRADDYADQFSPTSPGVVGEAAKAVVDRVFGVKGEAADIRYHALELSNHSPMNAGIRSALLPGWGQWFNRQPVKAAALFMAITAGAYGAMRSYDKSNDSYDSYKAIGVRNDSSFEDYERHRTQFYVLGGATIALWGYSVFDAYRHAYNPLWSREPSIQLTLQEDGASVEWRRRFQ
jgi:hypothetical protein